MKGGGCVGSHSKCVRIYCFDQMPCLYIELEIKKMHVCHDFVNVTEGDGALLWHGAL